MSIVKFNDQEQKRMKILSQVLFFIGKISKILLRVAIGFVVFAMITIPILISQIDIKDDKLVISGHIVTINELEDGARLSLDDGEHIIISDINKKDINAFNDIYNKYSKPVLIVLVEIAFIFLVGFLFLFSMIFNHLEKLFKNIHDGDTPFTLDNVNHIKMMSYLMIACIILSIIASLIFDIAMGTDIAFEFGISNIIEIIFLYTLSYIFKYGYHIQMDSKGKIYKKQLKDKDDDEL